MKKLGFLIPVSLYFLLCLPAIAFDHNHQVFDQFLSKHVKSSSYASQFDYAAAANDRSQLTNYTEALSKVDKSAFDQWEEKQQLSFLINAYNAFTLQLILDHYPVSSIKDRKITWLSPFNKKFFSLFGKKRSLADVEHEMIRKWYKEARIHFAIVCASIGCPALQNRAFTAERLEALLEKGATDFMSDRSRNEWDAEDRELEISKIFDWFAADFQRDFGSVKAFVVKYMPLTDDEKTAVLSASSDIEYKDYDWRLNDVISKKTTD